VAALNLRIEVLEQPDTRAGRVVGGELEEVELVSDRERAREVGDEEEARLERGDEQRVPSLVLERQLASELTYATVELLAREVDLADPRVD
jgi:hypothetical protein